MRHLNVDIDARLSSRCAFLPTSTVIDTMHGAGFAVVEAR